MNSTQSRHKNGFTLVENIIALAIVTVFIFLMFGVWDAMARKSILNRTVSSRDRILSSIRVIAGMPAALRNSMRAANNLGAIVNPELLACAGGNPVNSCASGVSHPFTLYSPIVTLDSSGKAVGIRAITSPLGDTAPLHFDTFGSPCAVSGPECPLMVFTTFKAQCGPAPLPNPAPPMTIGLLDPVANCTFADVIEVTYYVQLDPALAGNYKNLGAFLQPVSGAISTSVKLISGNVPQ